MARRVALTGADGFIGSWATKSLRAAGFEVRTLDRANEDLLRPSTLRGFLSGAHVVFHLAGKNRADDPDLFASNAACTVGLLDAIDRFAKDYPMVVYASSLQVYRATQTASRLREDCPVDAVSGFPASKLLAEAALGMWTKTGPKGAAVLRMSNAYGPGCRPYYNSVVATFLDQAQKGTPLMVAGGAQTRDFIYVGDVVKALLRLANKTIPGLNVFNLCTGRATSISELAESIRIIFPETTISTDGGPRTPQTHLVGDPSKLEKEIGFRPNTTLKDGLQRILQESV